jgi:vancomycin resistance protein VanW
MSWRRHPLVREARITELRLARRLSDTVRRPPFASRTSAGVLPVVFVRHRSLLRRQLGETDPALQETKIVNLRIAVATLDGLLLAPGEVVSFWQRVGSPTRERGFVEGLVLAGGEVRTGIGGGLCQLSNLLYWMALHTPLEIVEHHHHGFDPFPDFGRVLPFGSGASVAYNYVDLRVANPTQLTLQLRVRVGATHLEGEIRTDRPWPYAYHVAEHGHRFVRAADGSVWRENELWRRTISRRTGDLVEERLVTRNHARVCYAVPDGLLGTDEPSPRAPGRTPDGIPPRPRTIVPVAAN